MCARKESSLHIAHVFCHHSKHSKLRERSWKSSSGLMVHKFVHKVNPAYLGVRITAVDIEPTVLVWARTELACIISIDKVLNSLAKLLNNSDLQRVYPFSSPTQKYTSLLARRVELQALRAESFAQIDRFREFQISAPRSGAAAPFAPKCQNWQHNRRPYNVAFRFEANLIVFISSLVQCLMLLLFFASATWVRNSTFELLVRNSQHKWRST